MREIWKNHVWSGWQDCVAAVFGVCYVELAFGEQNFNEEIKLGRDGRTERTGISQLFRALL